MVDTRHPKEIGTYWHRNFVNNQRAATFMECDFRYYLCNTNNASKWPGHYCRIPAIINVSKLFPNIKTVLYLDTDVSIANAMQVGIHRTLKNFDYGDFTYLTHSHNDDGVSVHYNAKVNASVITSLARFCGQYPGMANENVHIRNVHCTCMMIWRMDKNGVEIANKWLVEAKHLQSYPENHTYTYDQDAFNRMAKINISPFDIIALPHNMFSDFPFFKKACHTSWWKHNDMKYFSLSHRNKSRDHKSEDHNMNGFRHKNIVPFDYIPFFETIF